MDKQTENLLDTIAQKSATDAVAKMREFHLDDLKAVGERIDIGFTKVEHELNETNTHLERIADETNTRLEQIENALATLLQ